MPARCARGIALLSLFDQRDETGGVVPIVFVRAVADFKVQRAPHLQGEGRAGEAG